MTTEPPLAPITPHTQEHVNTENEKGRSIFRNIYDFLSFACLLLTLSRPRPQTREGIEKRLAELEHADIADEVRKADAGKTIQAMMDSLKNARRMKLHLKNAIASIRLSRSLLGV